MENQKVSAKPPFHLAKGRWDDRQQGKVTATGSTPLWAPDVQPNMTLHLNQVGYTVWPGTKIVWEVGPDYTQTVTVKVTNLRTGELAWWDTGEGAPPPTYIARTLVLDQHHKLDSCILT